MFELHRVCIVYSQRDREEGHLIQALYTDVESMARTDLTNLQ